MSQDADDLELDLNEMLMGSEEAVARVAARMRGALPQPTDEVEERIKFLNQVDKFRQEYPDVTHDDEAYALAVQVDKGLAARAPNMDYGLRLKLVGDAVREKLGDPEERDYKSAIAEMKVSRIAAPNDRAARHREAMELAEASNYDLVQSEIDRSRSEQIAEIISTRKGRMVENKPREKR